MVNVFSELRTLMTPICPDIFANVRAAGENGAVNRSADFMVMSITDDRPSLWGDDSPTNDTVTVRINYFTKSPNKCPAKKIQIRKALENAGYIWQSSTELYEETGYTHLAIEAEKEYIHDNEVEE